MSNFLAGLITGSLSEVVVTLLVLRMIVSGVKGSEKTSEGQVPNRKVFLAAAMLAWFLPPNGSLTVTGLDNRLALALFVLRTVAGSIAAEGDQWLNRGIT